jgi:tetratricopeptide (TPR) repeat protein
MKQRPSGVSHPIAFIAALFFFMAQLPAGAVSAADQPANRPAREWAEQALQASLHGKYDEAISEAGKVIQLKPDNAEDQAKAYFARGLALYNKGQKKEAISDLNWAVNFWPTFLDAYVIRSNAKSDLGMYEAAIQDQDMALKIKPDYARAYSDRGFAYYKKGMYAQAIADSTRSLELNPNDPNTLDTMGHIFLKKGDYDLAIQKYSKGLELNSKSGYRYMYRASAYLKKKEYDQVLADCQKGAELVPGLAEIYDLKGQAYTAKKEYDPALQNFDTAIKLNPESAYYHFDRGMALKEMGRTQEGLTEVRKAADMDPKVEKFKKGIAEFDQKNPAGQQPLPGTAVRAPSDIMAREKAALKALQEKDTPENRKRLAAARHDRAFMVLDHPKKEPDKKALEEAVAYAQSAARLEPGNAGHWFLTGLLFRELAGKDKRAAVMAEQALRQSVDIDPEYAAGWLELGLMMVGQERGWEAMTALENTLESDPARTALVAVGPLCAMYAMNDEGPRGAGFFRELYAKNPEVSALGVGSAIMLDALGDREAAIGQARDVMILEAAGTPEHDYAAKLVKEWEGVKP